MQEKSFDFEKYSRALENFISDIQDTKFLGLEDTGRSLSALCSLLRIGRIEMKKNVGYQNYTQLHGDLEAVYYDSPEADYSRTFVSHEVGGRMVAVDYTFFQIKGDEAWTAAETIHLATLGKIIYTYSSAYLLMNYVNYSHFHDLRFTNVSNLNFLQSQITKLIQQKQIHSYGVAYCNLHHFSLINRKIGQKKGTDLLEQYLTGLSEIVNQSSVEWEKGYVCAFGADIFAVLFHKSVQPFVMNYLSGTEFTIKKDDGETEVINVVARSGMNLNLGEFDNYFEIMDSVSLAMNTARRREGVKIVFYDNELKTSIDRQREIETLYTDALKNEEFQVYFQPKVDLHSYQVKGAEALVRWTHNGKMIMPDEFIPVLERNLSIKYLDLYMLNHVCSYMREWLDTGKTPVQVSVNLSRASLSITNIVMVITSIIDKFKVPRSLIQIELTESASGSSAEELSSIVRELSQEGISTAMDDFGTGFSSLSLIKELPWNVLKIDKSLLEGAQKTGSYDQRMFKAIISMANEIGLECIVEGVETREDVKLLKESHCWMAQGFYFSKPLPKEEFEKLI